MNILISKNFSFDKHDAPVYALEPFYDKGFFSGGGDRIISLRGLNSADDSKGIVNTGTTIYSLKFIPDKQILLAGVSGGGMHVIDLSIKKEIHFLLFHEKGIYTIHYSPLNDLVITSGGDGKIAFWKGEKISFLKSISLCNAKIRSVSLDRSETIAAVGCGDGTIRFIDLKSLEQINVISAHSSSVNAVCFHPELELIISGGKDAYLKMWDTKSFRLYNSIPAHNYSIYSIVFSPDKKIFATCSRDKTIKIWDSRDMNFLYKIDQEKNQGHKHSVNKLIWIRDHLISASDDRNVLSWEVKAVEKE